MTINIHSLLHLPQVARYLGPLWAYSCFFFEGLTSVLLKNIHGTQYVGLQMHAHLFNAARISSTGGNAGYTQS